MKLVKILSLLALFALAFSAGSCLFAMDKNGAPDRNNAQARRLEEYHAALIAQQQPFLARTATERARVAEQQPPVFALPPAALDLAANVRAADRSAEQFRRETESKLARAAEREHQEVQAIADEINAQEDEEEVRDAADYSDDELESTKQVDLKDQVAQQQDQAQHDLKAAEDILYNFRPTVSQGFKGPGLPKNLQQLVANYVGSDGQAGWRLLKTIEGLKGPVVARIAGKFMRDQFGMQQLLESQVASVGCAIAGKFMITGEADGGLKLWSINPYNCIAQLNLGSPIHSIATNHKGELIAVSFTNKDVVVIVEIVKENNEQKLKIKKILKDDRLKSCSTIYFSMLFASEKTTASNTHEVLITTIPFKTILAWSMQTWTVYFQSEVASEVGDESFYCIKHQHRLVTPAHLFNQNTRRFPPPLICFHPSHNSSNYHQLMKTKNLQSKAIGIYDASTELLTDILSTGQKDIISLQSFYTHKYKNGYLVSSSSDGTVKIWEHSLFTPFKQCAHCKKDKYRGDINKLMACMCKQIKYCSPECQKADWKNHKATCTAKKPNKEVRTIDQLD